MFTVDALPIALIILCTCFQAILVAILHRRLARIASKAEKSLTAEQGLLVSPAEFAAEIDSLFFDSGEYQALRRMGVSAPLLGVLASAILLTYWKPMSETAGGAAPLDLRHLFGGVFAGVLVAIINQGCLWWVELAYRRIRQRIEAGLPKSQVIAAVDEFKSSIESLTGQYRRALDAALASATDAAREQVSHLFAESRSAIDGMTALLTRSSQAIERQVAGAEKASLASDTYIEAITAGSSRFGTTLGLLQASLGEVTSQVDSAMRSLDANANALVTTGQTVHERSTTLMNSLESSHEVLLAGLRGSTRRISDGFMVLSSLI